MHIKGLATLLLQLWKTTSLSTMFYFINSEDKSLPWQPESYVLHSAAQQIDFYALTNKMLNI